MSLFPHWHSSIFGLIRRGGMGSGGGCPGNHRCAVRAVPRNAKVQPVLMSLGNLLLMFVLAWSYLAFMQYLTVWIADLPAETTWYIPRTLTSWRDWAWFLIAFHFAVPFSHPAVATRQAASPVLAARRFTATAREPCRCALARRPQFPRRRFALRWTDLFAPVGMGALWCSFYLGQFRRRIHA